MARRGVGRCQPSEPAATRFTSFLEQPRVAVALAGDCRRDSQTTPIKLGLRLCSARQDQNASCAIGLRFFDETSRLTTCGRRRSHSVERGARLEGGSMARSARSSLAAQTIGEPHPIRTLLGTCSLRGRRGARHGFHAQDQRSRYDQRGLDSSSIARSCEDCNAGHSAGALMHNLVRRVHTRNLAAN